MIPGEVTTAEGEIELNAGREAVTLMVANTGDRPVQVGSHFHFAEANAALDFDREAARGKRLDLAAGSAVRFEPGQRREVRLIDIAGDRKIFGFNGKVMGPLAIALGLLVSPSPSEAQTYLDCTNPTTQVEMTGCASKAWEEADANLNRVYVRAVTAARDRDGYLAEEAVTNEEILRDAQRAWVPFRDAACEAEATLARGGTLSNQLFYICLERLTRIRTEDLQYYAGGLTGSQE